MRNNIFKLIVVALITFNIMILTNGVIKLNIENKELKNRVKQLEINYKLYEYDFNQIREYRGY